LVSFWGRTLPKSAIEKEGIVQARYPRDHNGTTERRTLPDLRIPVLGIGPLFLEFSCLSILFAVE
jgi:hypothetical protein